MKISGNSLHHFVCPPADVIVDREEIIDSGGLPVI